MDGLRQRLMTPRRHLWVALGLVVFGLLAALYVLSAQQSAAHPAKTGDTVMLTFTVTVKAGTPPADTIFWLCPDAQPDGTGCNEMTAQPDGSFTFQLTTTTGTIYHHIVIEWSLGLLPTSTGTGAKPEPPAQISCSYTSLTVTKSDSVTCQTDFSMLAITPTFPVSTNTPAPTASASTGAATGSDDTGTLITGLYMVIGVGLVLFVILLIILIWQRVSARRRAPTRRRINTQHR